MLGLARVLGRVVALAGLVGCGSAKSPGLEAVLPNERKTAIGLELHRRLPAQIFAVPIDVLAVNATLLFDLSTSSARATATMRFRMGARQGHPMFDLRQNIEDAALDGSAISPADMPSGRCGRWAGCRNARVAPGARGWGRTCPGVFLRLEPPARKFCRSGAAALRRFGVHWNFNLSDYYAGHFLEQWLPTDPIHDRFPVTLDLDLVGGAQPHTLLANGSVEEIAPNRFHVAFPGHYVAHSHFLVLEPTAQLADRRPR